MDNEVDDNKTNKKENGIFLFTANATTLKQQGKFCLLIQCRNASCITFTLVGGLSRIFWR